MSTHTLWILTFIVAVFVVLLGWCMVRIAAKSDARAAGFHQHVCIGKWMNGECRCVLCGARMPDEPMPGARELYFDKKPRGQKIARKQPLLGCERGGNAHQRRIAHRAALQRLGEAALRGEL